MPELSERSLAVLESVDERLQRVTRRVAETFPCIVLEGHRNQALQDRYYQLGTSKVTWPNSKHNRLPSLAIDLVPEPIDWNDRERFHFFAGFVLAIARELGVDLVWGGDWDSDRSVRDNSFDDLGHFELRD